MAPVGARVTNDDQALADEIAPHASDLVWELREPLANRRIPKTRDGVIQALTHQRRGGSPSY
jgi:hypothetical protein